jgi:hypothetical protein
VFRAIPNAQITPYQTAQIVRSEDSVIVRGGVRAVEANGAQVVRYWRCLALVSGDTAILRATLSFEEQ